MVGEVEVMEILRERLGDRRALVVGWDHPDGSTIVQERKMAGFTAVLYSDKPNAYAVVTPVPEDGSDAGFCFTVLCDREGVRKMSLLNLENGNGRIREKSETKLFFVRGKTPWKESIANVAEKILLGIPDAPVITKSDPLWKHVTLGVNESSIRPFAR